MIQSILFFMLGFLCAGFLALMVAPAIWRRAVVLTRKRIEASVPLSLNELQADKDRTRAQFAMSIRRLEMDVKSLREKAADQIIEINRNRAEINRLADERAAQDEALAGMEAQAGELRAELRQREEQLQDLSGKLADAEAALEERALELEKLGRLYDDASFSSSSRQIELVARETEVEKLSADISELRDRRKEAERRLREIANQRKAAQDELKLEKRRNADLEARLERLIANLSDHEEKLDRRDKELERLREEAKTLAGAASDASTTPTSPQEEKKLNADRERLEVRLTALVQENRKLREELTAPERSGPHNRDDERHENALLREQINDIAAEVVNLAMMLDGPDSPIRKALARPDPAPAEAAAERPASLADRVRALQEAAAR